MDQFKVFGIDSEWKKIGRTGNNTQQMSSPLVINRSFVKSNWSDVISHHAIYQSVNIVNLPSKPILGVLIILYYFICLFLADQKY